MKHSILLLICALTLSTVLGQGYSRSFVFDGKPFHFKGDKIDDMNFQVVLEESPANRVSYTLTPLSVETFNSFFAANLKLLLPEGQRALSADKEKELQARSQELFNGFIIAMLTGNESDAPLAGTLTIPSEVTAYWGNNDAGDPPVGRIRIKDVSFEFHEGFLEIVKVNGVIEDSNAVRQLETLRNQKKTKGKADTPPAAAQGTVPRPQAVTRPLELVFINKYGIGFASRGNFRALHRIALFDQVSAGENAVYIKVGDLLQYDYEIQLLNRDFSPYSQSFKTTGGKTIKLYKEETSKLFEAIVYTDVKGWDEDNPNGLIQTEFSKRINLMTTRRQSFRFVGWLGRGVGALHFIRPALTLSKLEEKNKYLVPYAQDEVVATTVNNVTSHSLRSARYATPLQVLRYQKYAVGLDMNLLFLDNWIYHLYLNAGFRFGSTSVADSVVALNPENKVVRNGLVKEYDLDYLVFYPEVMVQFWPDARFSLSLAYRPQHISFISDEVQTANFDKYTKALSGEVERVVNTYEIAGYARVGDNGRIFVRWRLFSEKGNLHQHFSQQQFGYSFFILKNRSK
ncbi:hypothetical protein [Rufibacter sp. LB8]|uniref:hypothetical protein n=1 Tax=Rufibacter sp. LB8 TaxID=2777781 RepID=UPI00178C613E|nr:hypothetical protein [Rufibacter sp. LB8]